jgi:hypothetical protein
MNEKSGFYHKGRDWLILLYVDDIWMDGNQEDVEWFGDQIGNRFECKDIEWLTEGSPIDYLGMELNITPTHIHMSMPKYIKPFLEMMNMTNCSTVSTPLPGDIIPKTLLTGRAIVKFMMAVGCIGWMAQTCRDDMRYPHSRLAHHLGKPSVEAWNEVLRVCRYLQGKLYLGVGTSITNNKPESHPSHSKAGDQHMWTFYSDSDHAGNKEPGNKMRSQ